MSKNSTYPMPVQKTIWASIKAISYINEINRDKLAEILEVNPRTIVNYDHSFAANLTLRQLDNFLRAVGINLEDLIISSNH